MKQFSILTIGEEESKLSVFGIAQIAETFGFDENEFEQVLELLSGETAIIAGICIRRDLNTTESSPKQHLFSEKSMTETFAEIMPMFEELFRKQHLVQLATGIASGTFSNGHPIDFHESQFMNNKIVEHALMIMANIENATAPKVAYSKQPTDHVHKRMYANNLIMELALKEIVDNHTNSICSAKNIAIQALDKLR